MQWPSILEAVQSNQIVAAKVQKVSEERGLAMPDKIQNIIFTKIMQMRNQVSMQSATRHKVYKSKDRLQTLA